MSKTKNSRLLLILGTLGWVGLISCDGGDAEVGATGEAAVVEREDPDSFVARDSTLLMEELRVLSADSFQGRRTGETGNVMAREYILAAFREAGLLPLDSGFVQPFEFRDRRDTTLVVHGANVVGVTPGTDSTLGAIVLSAHFDHLGVRNGEVFNGADDNASGTVALMSLARYFQGNPLNHTVVFAALDGEEMGLRGARAFMAAGWPQEIVLNVNMDMVARSDSLLFASGTYHTPILRTILETVSDRPPVLLRFGHDQPDVEGMDDWSRSSDHQAFFAEGIPFVYFGVEDHDDYHRPTDDFDLIDPAFMVNAVRMVLAGVIALDAGLQGLGPDVDGNAAGGLD